MRFIVLYSQHYLTVKRKYLWNKNIQYCYYKFNGKACKRFMDRITYTF